MKKKKILTGSSFISIFIFCEKLNFNIFIRSNINGNLTDDKNWGTYMVHRDRRRPAQSPSDT